MTFGWLQKLLHLSRSRGDDAKVAFSNREKFEQMIRTPDWGMVADVLGQVPPALQALYATDCVIQSYWEVDTGRSEDAGAYEIAEFNALRPEWRENLWPELRDGCLSFAGDGFGNEFFLKSGSGPKWPVYFYDHEGGEITQLADTLDEFLSMLRPSQSEET